MNLQVGHIDQAFTAPSCHLVKVTHWFFFAVWNHRLVTLSLLYRSSKALCPKRTEHWSLFPLPLATDWTGLAELERLGPVPRTHAQRSLSKHGTVLSRPPTSQLLAPSGWLWCPRAE